MQGYGLTETSPVVLLQERGCCNYASVGSPAPNTDCKIVDLDNEKHVLGPNQVCYLHNNLIYYSEFTKNNLNYRLENFGYVDHKS